MNGTGDEPVGERGIEAAAQVDGVEGEASTAVEENTTAERRRG